MELNGIVSNVFTAHLYMPLYTCAGSTVKYLRHNSLVNYMYIKGPNPLQKFAHAQTYVHAQHACFMANTRGKGFVTSYCSID